MAAGVVVRNNVLAEHPTSCQTGFLVSGRLRRMPSGKSCLGGGEAH